MRRRACHAEREIRYDDGVITHTVLLVESDAQCADRLTTVLHSAGYVVRVAPTAQAARTCARRSEADLIVLDRQLPDEDGLRLCASLRAESDVPIVVSGAGLERRTVVAALKLGADDVLGERCEPDEVLARIEAVLRRARAQRSSSNTASPRT